MKIVISTDMSRLKNKEIKEQLLEHIQAIVNLLPSDIEYVNTAYLKHSDGSLYFSVTTSNTIDTRVIDDSSDFEHRLVDITWRSTDE